MNYGLEGRVALVTGADSGMGFQTATLLLLTCADTMSAVRVMSVSPKLSVVSMCRCSFVRGM